MIRSTATARPLDRRHAMRYGAAVVGVLGAVTLAGCSTASPDAGSGSNADGGADTGVRGEYTDGTYTASGSYQTPESVESIDVTVTLEDGVITTVDVTGDPQRSESARYQSEFIEGIDAEVVGKNIDDISVSRVAGSSLTSGGFNEAIEEIKTEATA